MKTLLAVSLAALGLAACAAPESGIRDPEAFASRAERTTLSGRDAPAAVAACFAETATLLPGSTVLADGDGRGATYTLRPFGYSFEQMRFRPAGGGTEVTVLLAPGVNDRWRRDFERDRLAPLRACLD
jgi:hypothetical protein